MAESELTTVARPYARAVFAHALDSREGLGDWSDMLRILADTAANNSVQEVLDNPALTKTQRVDLLVSICGDRLNEQAGNFIQILAEQNRIELLPQICTLYELMRADHEKTLDVELTSAYEIGDREFQRIQDILKDKLQREVRIESKVDPSLLGGAIVRTEDTVIDYSVRGKLAKLAQAMNS
ncbi:MAG: F0F1 ATP synthase subunit delta [Pseudomonadales bacterium]|jgi:F-type H+-transporting ATPase subunit delta|nr:F0F1 ATP synthase subunit delta [Pseudomonadales bacterium]MDP7144381.1 F0F1 ATP synthase subunit delta [Pseudomonadales bacterium]MDP7360897.1 F0F1 ATP synthase subunit delta [Pseudomonadales bacterium]HJN52094.1 F0F1 ATP synthase subunit delta [Pseudomonadales bacterium]|tara:strand:+ start:1014 stop:1559 length:546 start_codon:yes stop_codon:yes gene_type:complete